MLIYVYIYDVLCIQKHFEKPKLKGPWAFQKKHRVLELDICRLPMSTLVCTQDLYISLWENNT